MKKFSETKGRFIKVRVTTDEYKRIRDDADKRGLTISSLMRLLLDTERSAVEISQLISELRVQLELTTSNVCDERLQIREALLILRELASLQNLQILGRVAQRLREERKEDSHD